MMNFWTGFPNYETFYALYQFFETRAKHLRYWKGDIGMPQIFSEKKRGPERKLPHELKIEETDPTEIENLTAKSSTNKSTFKRTIVRKNSSINGSFRSGPLFFSLNISKAMRDFEDVRVILDCTEIFVQNPSKLDARKQVYSNYKHHNTFKFSFNIPLIKNPLYQP
jgi:hypothetical protein